MKKSIEKFLVHVDFAKDSVEAKNIDLKLLLENIDNYKNGTVSHTFCRIGNSSIGDLSLKEILDELSLDSLNKKSIIQRIEENLDLIYRLEKLKEIFLTPDSKLKIGDKYISCFFYFSLIIDIFEFKDNEIFDVIKEALIINRKVDCAYDENTVSMDSKKLLSFSFKSVTPKERDYYLGTGMKTLLIRRDELDQKGQAFVDEIMNNLDKFKIDEHDECKKALVKLSEILLDKEYTYSKEDITDVVVSLKVLRLCEKGIKSIKRYLEINLEKRLKKEESKAIYQIDASAKKSPEYLKSNKHYITDDEYKKLKRKLKEYYDPYNKNLKKEVSYEEMIEIASVMIKLEYDKDEVYTFIKMCKMFLDVEVKNNISLFIGNYDKYIFYLGGESVLEICEYLKEMIVVTDEEYVLWKEEVEKLISNLNELLPNKAEYEYQLAKKM